MWLIKTVCVKCGFLIGLILLVVGVGVKSYQILIISLEYLVV